MKEFLILFIAMSCSSTLVFAQIQEVKPHEASVPVHEMELTFKDFISWIGLDAGIRRIETGEVTQRHVTIISTVLRRTREVEMHRMRVRQRTAPTFRRTVIVKLFSTRRGYQCPMSSMAHHIITFPSKNGRCRISYLIHFRGFCSATRPKIQQVRRNEFTRFARTSNWD